MDDAEWSKLSDYSYRVARNFLGSSCEARDLAQIAMEICYRRRLRFGKTARAFVRKVTRGVCVDYLRHMEVLDLHRVANKELTLSEWKTALDATGYAESMEQILYYHDLASAIQRGARLLAPMQQRVFEMRRLGYRYREIAEELGVADSTARNHLRAAYGAMKNYLTAWGFAPTVPIPGKLA